MTEQLIAGTAGTVAVMAIAPAIPEHLETLCVALGFVVAYAVRWLEIRYRFTASPRRRNTHKKRRRRTNKPPVIKS